MDQLIAGYSIKEYALFLALISVGLSLALTLNPLWKLRYLLAISNIILMGIIAGIYIVISPYILGLLFVFFQIYRILINLRIVENRINPIQLKIISRRSETTLALITLVLSSVIYTDVYFDSNMVLLTLAISQLIFASILLKHTTHMKRAMTVSAPRRHIADVDLPTLTLAIPARNETTELADCLQSVLLSTYPKLEVLVLDDCSQDKTSDIIRSFAHRGVRFLKGKPPPSHWIAKNYAYQQLFDNASGDIIIFCGSDVRFEPEFLTNYIETLMQHKYDMMSVLPLRHDRIGFNYLLQPMRYWRELVFPLSNQHSWPALSTCWVVRTEALNSLGGFEGIKQSIRPEKQVARVFHSTYRFVRSNDYLRISSVKSLSAQWNTAIRTRYPELHRRPETVAITTVWQLLILFGPVFTFLGGIYIANITIVGFSLIAGVMLLVTQFNVYKMITNQNSIFPIILFPLNVAMELVTLNYSMWAYEFSKVIWRGRNICMPVLDRIPSLPKID